MFPQNEPQPQEPTLYPTKVHAPQRTGCDSSSPEQSRSVISGPAPPAHVEPALHDPGHVEHTYCGLSSVP